MKSILQEFANGNIPSDPDTLKKDSPYTKSLNRIANIENKLLRGLDDALKELLESLIDAQLEAAVISNNEKFIDGYRLGVLMTMEVFMGREDLFKIVD